MDKNKERLEYLRKEIEAERISYEEIAELKILKNYIEPGDVVLLEWAGVPEFPVEELNVVTCGECGHLFAHELGEESLTCPYCK